MPGCRGLSHRRVQPLPPGYQRIPAHPRLPPRHPRPAVRARGHLLMMKKILIIEDDQIVANIYRNKFAVEGYDVVTAADGQSGLESIHNLRPDAVVLDLMLPKLSGVELMKKLRAE